MLADLAARQPEHCITFSGDSGEIANPVGLLAYVGQVNATDAELLRGVEQKQAREPAKCRYFCFGDWSDEWKKVNSALL
jgi:hypothetical protein